jgi:phenylacetate-coenzyme A ligase PaaK-like adenylate-forming protein
MIETLSKNIFHPLWDIKDKSNKLKYVRSLEKSQWLTAAELKEKQWTALKKTIDYAYNNSPYYSDLFKSLGIRPADINTPEDYLKIPVTTKLDIRNNTERFISSEYTKESLVVAKTGGSTGVSLNLYFDETCQELRNAAAIRSDRWAGWNLGHKRAALWGNPPEPTTFKQKVRHHLLDRTIYLDTMALNDKTMGTFVERWQEEKPKSLFGHAHSIYMFAKYIAINKIDTLRPQAIVATSMMLLDHERVLIESVFQCKVTNRYGCEEVGLIGCECEKHQGMHLNIDHLYVEFIDDDNIPVAPGESGKIVLTDFNNRGMPLLRYQVEDIGVPSDKLCSCGRGLPLMEGLQGRVADFLKGPDGSLVAGISLVERTLTHIKGLEQIQLVQPALNRIEINRVKGADYDENTDPSLLAEIKTVFGNDVECIINDVAEIAQENNGKYRFSICKV